MVVYFTLYTMCATSKQKSLVSLIVSILLILSLDICFNKGGYYYISIYFILYVTSFNMLGMCNKKVKPIFVKLIIPILSCSFDY